MPVIAQSRAKVTDSHGPYSVGEFGVCRVGGIVALHLSTPAGRFVFHVAERDFTLRARGDHDRNGHPFRQLGEIDRPEDSETTNPRTRERKTPSPQSSPSSTSRVLPPSSSLQKAWEMLTQNLHLRVADVAQEFGIPIHVLDNFILRSHPRELTALRRAAGLPTRPSGLKPCRLMARRPLLKPNGKLL